MPIPRCVALRLIPACMRFSVNLDREPRLQAGEVEPIGRLRVLSAELEAAGTLAQGLPEQHLGQEHAAPVDAGLFEVLDRGTEHLGQAWAPSTSLRLVPLPVPGRN